MGYADHEDPRADSAEMFGALHHESADGVQYADSGMLPGAPHPDQVPRRGTGSRSEADTGTYPVLGRYAGYERSGDGWAVVHHEVAGNRPFNRVYARPADPGQTRPPGEVYGRTRDRAWRPDRWVIAGGSLAAAVVVVVAFATAGGSPAARGGSPAASRGASATSGGASATGPAAAHTVTARGTQPACVSPAPGQ